MALTTEPDLTIPMHQRLPEDFIWEKLNALQLSKQERVWLLKHLEESPARALKEWDKAIPHNPEPEHSNFGKEVSVNPWCVDHPGVEPKGMERLLRRIRDVEDATPDRFGFYRRLPQIAPLVGGIPNEEFRGLDAIRVCVEDATEYMRRYTENKEKSPTTSLHPTLHTKDARGHLSWQGVGSDRGIVRAFVCWILHDEAARVDPVWAAAAATDAVPLVADGAAQKVEGIGADYRLIEGPNFWECPVKECNKRIDFKPDDKGDKDHQYHNMRKHMMMAKKSVDDHREAKLVIFG